MIRFDKVNSTTAIIIVCTFPQTLHILANIKQLFDPPKDFHSSFYGKNKRTPSWFLQSSTHYGPEDFEQLTTCLYMRHLALRYYDYNSLNIPTHHWHISLQGYCLVTGEGPVMVMWTIPSTALTPYWFQLHVWLFG